MLLQSYNATVNDILKFRKALTYMDLEHPFSEAFGPASTRDEMIDSAELVYERLLRLSPGTVNLSFSVLQLLCIQDDGVQDKAKLQTLKTLFRPNSKGELTLVTFVQACDSVYRRLRYLRASVGNSSVIDQVLESILDSIFSFMYVDQRLFDSVDSCFLQKWALFLTFFPLYIFSLSESKISTV